MKSMADIRYSLHETEEAYEWRKWMVEIPFINWPSTWWVKAVPPFHTGVIRYWVKSSKDAKESVSIYLDCYDRAGSVGQPYWEIYPVDGDCERVLFSEPVENLLEVIAKSLKQLDKK